MTDIKKIYETEAPVCFNLGLSLDCGQAFRWEYQDGRWHGAAFGKEVYIAQKDGRITFWGADSGDFESVWRAYFDWDCDYKKILDSYDDKYLIEAAKQYGGIRILRQEPWEALCSFIISQNNNIPRIKGIIGRLCGCFGEGDGLKSFPSPERLAVLSPDDLAPLRAGFRARYLIDAANKVALGDIDFAQIDRMPIEYGREQLKKIKGVGDKVAECALLYGFHKIEAFPVDVWVKRIMAEMYPGGLPECARGTEGIAQQYLFHWRRMKDRQDNK